MLVYRPQLVAVLLGALAAITIVACTGPAGRDAQTGPTETLPTGDAAVAATANARQPTPGATPTRGAGPNLEPARSSVIPAAAPAPRAIATGVVDRIAFSDGRGSIFTVSPDGTGLTTIAEGSLFVSESNYAAPVWSPDGGSLAFSSLQAGSDSFNRTILYRADANGNGSIVTLAVDDRSLGSLGPGIPQFSAWSPDGELIALIAAGEFGIKTMFIGSNSGESPNALGLGAPLYFSWAPDGAAILIHRGEGLSVVPVTDSGSGTPIAVGVGSVSFNVPAWAPDSKSFAHVENIAGTSFVVLTRLGEINNHEIIGEAIARVALRWSPDGKSLAITRSSGAGAGYQTLSLYSPGDSSERIIHRGDIGAFWWSPDSSRLAILENSRVIDFAFVWTVLDVESGETTPLITLILPDDFLFVQAFFDQFVESHNIWSTESSRIVVTGSLPGPGRDAQSASTADQTERFDFRVWVLDATGVDEPHSIGRGTIANWSPR